MKDETHQMAHSLIFDATWRILLVKYCPIVPLPQTGIVPGSCWWKGPVSCLSYQVSPSVTSFRGKLTARKKACGRLHHSYPRLDSVSLFIILFTFVFTKLWLNIKLEKQEHCCTVSFEILYQIERRIVCPIGLCN